MQYTSIAKNIAKYIAIMQKASIICVDKFFLIGGRQYEVTSQL